MAKKKQKTAPIHEAAVPSASSADGIDSLIHSHREFFDHLIELIPSRFYLSNDDSESKPWYQGLSKSAKASLKQQSKQNLKLARRNRFDPDNTNTRKTPTSGDGDESVAKPIDTEKSVTYEELREKLRRKIELLKGNRGEKVYDGKKRKRGGESEGEKDKEVGLNDEDGEEIIEYGKLSLGDEDYGKKRRKLSKAKELERAKRSEELKKQNPYVAERESWKAATSRAMGVKVHDDARLIKGSMKREKRKKEKNAGKWKERVETQEKMKEERQRKRRENIAGRINEKKMRKIAKREKKLMRPGFEGRKEGFITPAS